MGRDAPMIMGIVLSRFIAIYKPNPKYKYVEQIMTTN